VGLGIGLIRVSGVRLSYRGLGRRWILDGRLLGAGGWRLLAGLAGFRWLPRRRLRIIVMGRLLRQVRA